MKMKVFWSIIIIAVLTYPIVWLIQHQDADGNLGYLGQAQVTEPAPVSEDISTEDAIKYITLGQEILDTGLEAFEVNATKEMALVLSDIYIDYTEMLKVLCEIEGTADVCISAFNTVKATYNALAEYSNE